jgi:hypothetical protein
MDKGKGLIRSLNRRGTRSAKVRPVEARAGRPREGAVCERCGAMFSRRTWRRDHAVSDSLLARAAWVVCPACQQTGREEYFGRVLIRGGAAADEDAIRRRIQNVAARAGFTQPERQIVSVERRGDVLEVLTTSQKLAPDRPRAEEGLRRPHVLRMVGRSDPACELAAPRGTRHKAKKTPIGRLFRTSSAQRTRHEPRRLDRLLCYVIFMADSATIGDLHVCVGIVAGDGTAIWPLAVGPARAKGYLLTGDPLLAAEASVSGW